MADTIPSDATEYEPLSERAAVRRHREQRFRQVFEIAADRLPGRAMQDFPLWLEKISFFKRGSLPLQINAFQQVGRLFA